MCKPLPLVLRARGAVDLRLQEREEVLREHRPLPHDLILPRVPSPTVYNCFRQLTISLVIAQQLSFT